MSTTPKHPKNDEPGDPLHRPGSDYNPVECLQKEVERFKATNRFSPLLVTNFYCQAAVVLTYVQELEEALNRMVRAAEYVAAHNYGRRSPVGTRIIAVSDLTAATHYAKAVVRPQNEVGSGAKDQ